VSVERSPCSTYERRRDRHPYTMPLAVVLYTRRGCHLCDDAKQLLVAHGLHPKEVDIDGDPELVERYGLLIPVVEIDGRERFRGRIDPVLLRRLIADRA
jgi:glutaredoxin